MHILFATPELSPFTEGSAVAEFTRRLAAEIKLRGHEVSVITPLYRWNDPAKLHLARRLREVEVKLDGKRVVFNLYEGRTPENVRVFFLANDALFGRHERLYTDENGQAYGDNAVRFGAFARGVCEFIKNTAMVVDIIQTHEWATALVPVFLEERYADEDELADLMVVQSVFGLRDQGQFPASVLKTLGLPSDLADPEALGDGKQVNFLQGGILYSDMILTQSERSAKELQSGQGARGLGDAFAERAEDTRGVMLGLDPLIWDSATDDLLPQRYDTDHLNGKRQCKASLQHTCGLPMRPRVPVLGIPGPFNRERGADVIFDILGKLLERELQLVFLGEGTGRYQQLVEQAAAEHPKNIYYQRDANEGARHRFIAGCDMLLLPHRFDPLGLDLMQALRYGTVPLANRTGAIADLLATGDEDAFGYVFDEVDAELILTMVDSALAAFAKQRSWREQQLRLMRSMRTWRDSANDHISMYEQLLS